MSLITQISSVITRIGTEFKTVDGQIGNLASLSTTAKTSLVAAINELVSSVGGAGASINDTTASTSSVYSSSKTEAVATTKAAALINDTAATTGSVYSSQKTIDAIAALKTELVNGASAALDTFGEIATQLAADESAAAALSTAVGNRLRFDAAQTLTAPQKAQAITNLGAVSAADVGDVSTDLVAVFTAALA